MTLWAYNERSILPLLVLHGILRKQVRTVHYQLTLKPVIYNRMVERIDQKNVKTPFIRTCSQDDTQRERYDTALSRAMWKNYS